ncbi:mitochondrial intermediate peptidase-like [Mya arenaria]|uniref:mitochondrial intermediate peptidase-like n=1 Tax=Mya arenaria TaxID=6604 RepID=UPI0022E2410C|nr:mitochondrial intermediate peptidase-like [Mya arenaria]
MRLSCLRRLCHSSVTWRHLTTYHQAYRRVSTLSPLSAAFNTKRTKLFNFKFRESKNVGLFQIPELTNRTGIEVLEERCVAQIMALRQEVSSPDRKRKLVVVLDEMSDSICRVADMLEFLRFAHPNVDFRDAAEASIIRLLHHVETLNVDVGIYEALQLVLADGDVTEMTEMDKRVIKLFMLDMEQSGIHLDQETREKYVKITNELVRITSNFSRGAHEPTPVMKFDLPKDITNIYGFSGTSTNVNAIKTNSEYETVREASYRVYLYPNPHQETLLQDMLEGRRLIAKLCGFPSFAHRALDGTLIQTPENAMLFLESMAENVREGAAKEYQTMHGHKQQLKGLEYRHQQELVKHDNIMPWDTSFFTSLAKQSLFSDSEVMEYFSLGNAMEGLSTLFQGLFGITLENMQPGAGELWHDEVYKLAVTHESEGLLGYIYCDFFERNEKNNQDSLFTIQGGKQLQDGKYQLPIVVLHLNLHRPSSGTPCLLSPSNLDNLFHEFGHAMHAMLGRQQYQHVTGTRCPLDFAEVPSVLMEYFASDPRVLKTFARHYRTGEPLDSDILRNVCRSKKLFLYSDTQQQIFYSIMDLVFHGPDFSPRTPIQILEEVQNQYYGIPYVNNTAWHQRFSHLPGYGSKYYSYQVSRSIASKIWRQMFKKDPFSRENGEKYRHQMLAYGGAKHPSELIQDLLGETPTIEMLVKSLSEDLHTRNITASPLLVMRPQN